jgi:hypothetical protein
MLSVLTRAGDHINSVKPGDFGASHFSVGSNPFNDSAYIDPSGEVKMWLKHEAIMEFARFCQMNIDAVYRRMAAETSKEESRYFAEKMGANFVPWLCWEFYDHTKEIILVRDPADWVCSQLSFFRRKIEFSSETSSLSDVEWVKKKIELLQSLEEALEARSNRVHVVKYEDLIRDAVPTMRSIFEYLGVDVPNAFTEASTLTTMANEGVPEGHRTYADDRETIGRWKRDLHPLILSSCAEQLDHYRKVFGYEA